MKQFIVLLAVLPLMLVFVVQYSVEQVHHQQIMHLNQYIYTAKEQAKQDGYYTQENLDTLSERICTEFDVTADEVSIEATDSVRYRKNAFDEREIISCRVSVPVKNKMAGAGFFGLSEEENTAFYIAESIAASERLQY